MLYVQETDDSKRKISSRLRGSQFAMLRQIGLFVLLVGLCSSEVPTKETRAAKCGYEASSIYSLVLKLNLNCNSKCMER